MLQFLVAALQEDSVRILFVLIYQPFLRIHLSSSNLALINSALRKGLQQLPQIVRFLLIRPWPIYILLDRGKDCRTEMAERQLSTENSNTNFGKMRKRFCSREAQQFTDWRDHKTCKLLSSVIFLCPPHQQKNRYI